jgi:lysophospholipase L1-like esterase
MTPVLAKFKNNFPDADFMIVSSADRAFRYDGEYKTAIGLPNLLETQAKLALDNGFAFYNQFETMGGNNSIVKWANENPPLANKDYVHPNGRGADILGEKLFDAVQKEYEKYTKKIGFKQ